MDQEIKKKYSQAEDLLDKAKEQLNKPEEDVVPYSICEHSYKAVINYLQSALLHRGISAVGATGVEALLQKCREQDAQFNDLHLHPMFNPTQTEDIWMNMDTAEDYLAMAENTRELVSQQLQ